MECTQGASKRFNVCGSIKRHVIIDLSALFLAFCTASVAQAQSKPDATPQIPYWSQWTDQSGQTHTTRCVMSGLKSQPFAASPQFVRRLPGEVESTIFTQLPVGWVGNWHMNPKRQWVIVLSGEYYMETSDGTSATLRAGDVFYGADQGAKPSATDPKKVGHFSRVVGNEPSNHVILQLKDDPDHKTGVACPY
jgi:quercetin dioxygenase-like cupin family protein